MPSPSSRSFQRRVFWSIPIHVFFPGFTVVILLSSSITTLRTACTASSTTMLSRERSWLWCPSFATTVIAVPSAVKSTKR